MANSDYDAGEKLILAAIRTLNDFNANNSSQADWGILNSGKARDYIILRSGPFTRAQQGLGGSYETKWVTFSEVWVRYIDDGSTQIRLNDQRQQIIDLFDAERKAGDTTGRIRDVFVRSGGEQEEMWKRGGNGPAWLRQELTIEWSEESETTLTD
jgi:hypothetical protein